MSTLCTTVLIHKTYKYKELTDKEQLKIVSITEYNYFNDFTYINNHNNIILAHFRTYQYLPVKTLSERP
jgi:hypothetical protein